MSTISDLQQKIGYTFQDIDLLERAVTHASFHGVDKNNERLEFLGDRVLGLIIAGKLFDQYGTEKEGDMAKRLTGVVQHAALLRVAEDIGLINHIRMATGTRKDAVLADAVEAFIGAVFIDGGYDAAQKVVLNLWADLLEQQLEPPEDPKTALQEWVQQRGHGLPIYAVTSKKGSDHAPIFEIEVSVEGLGSAKGKAPSKRAAEKMAAKLLLSQIKES